MNARKILQRFFVPSFVVTLVYWLKYRCQISPRAEVELSRLLVIGEGSRISSFSKIKVTGQLRIGKHVDIGSCCFIAAEAGGIQIGDYSLISPNVCIVGNNYRYDRLDTPIALQQKTSKGIRIGSDVWVGAGCVILDGAVIADHCIVAPNSVVKGRLEEGTVSEGNPAQPFFVRRA